MRARVAAGFLALGLALAACGGGSPPGDETPSVASTSGSAAPTASATPEVPSPTGTASQLPLDPRNRSSEAVTFPSTDGIRLAGRLYGTGPHGVVLAHMGSPRFSQADWLPVAVKLAKSGFRVLAFDYRGICFTPDPNVGCSEGDLDWPNAWRDIASAVDFLRGKGAASVVVVGADLGGTMALYAASRGMKVDGIVTVSGLEEGEGYRVDDTVLGTVLVPLLFIAGSQDGPAASAYRAWSRQVHEPATGLLLDTALHGTFLFDPFAPSDEQQAAKAIAAVQRFLQAND
jgi:pimeloyl-ACP methyl ester carboxylesterase